MDIYINDLQTIFDKLLQHVKEKGIESINVEADYYWNIPKEQLYNPYEQPSVLDLGQLSDDWYELRKIQHAEKEPIGYHLVWFAAILRVIGENLIL